MYARPRAANQFRRLWPADRLHRRSSEKNCKIKLYFCFDNDIQTTKMLTPFDRKAYVYKVHIYTHNSRLMTRTILNIIKKILFFLKININV